jgi:hypothetical protein
MNTIGLTQGSVLTRRRFLQLAGTSAAAVVLTQAVPRRAEAATWLLHDDTNMRGQGKLYSGTDDSQSCELDTGEGARCHGPGRLSCYWGALYVNSVTAHRLRTGPYKGCSGPPAQWPTWPGTGNAARVRWASHTADSVWTPEYRFVGRLYVYDIMARPDPWTGLVLHPVHINNCNNYWIRLWGRDALYQGVGYQDLVVWGWEVNNDEGWIISESLKDLNNPNEMFVSRNPNGVPKEGVWHDYRVDMLPGSRLKFYWDGELIFDATDPHHTFSGGPVGMRLDYFDTILDDTRVYRP